MSTSDPLRPFCLEIRRFVDIEEPLNEPGAYFGTNAPRIAGNYGHRFAEASANDQLDIYVVRISTPLYDFMYQAESGDHVNLHTPCFDSLVDDPAHCLVLLGEMLCYSEPRSGVNVFDSTSWCDTDTYENATCMIATFLGTAAPWRIMRACNDVESTHDLVFSTPPGDLFEIHQTFRSEWGSIYVKALEAWWKHVDRSL